MTSGSELLETLRNSGWEKLYPSDRIRVSVGLGTCGKAAGSQAVFDRLAALAEKRGLPVDVVPVGCAGMCFAEPLVEIAIPGWPRAVYGNVEVDSCEGIIDALSRARYPKKHRMGFIYRDWLEGFGTWIDLVDATPGEGEDEDETRPDDLAKHPFVFPQTKRLTASWGRIVPWSVAEYVAEGGYEALRRAVSEKSPDDLISAIEASGLRGRGGAGFPTGRKWKEAASSDDPLRFLIANADEGDPGAYMDRGLMESDPHRLIEGMAIAAFAIGAHKGIVFTRAEYPGAVEAVGKAIEEAKTAGIIGSNVLGSGWSFDIEIVRSAGAYVCGEEGALLEVLEGRRPDPRKKPPYPAKSGYLGHPTCINNVETLANVPSIALHGPNRFRSLGTAESPGTKIFSLAGNIERAGLVEVPFGTSLATIVCDIAGIAKDDMRNIATLVDKNEQEGCEETAGVAVQVGGPSGAILPLSLKGLTLDFEGLVQAGGIVGSGGIVVLGRRACVVDTIRYFLDFSSRESCGRCRACRDLLPQAANIVGLICSGEGALSMLDDLDKLSSRIAAQSRCGLGKMAVTPLASGLRYFRKTFEQHIAGSCPSLVCKNLMHFEVISEACPGCLCCLPSCPTNAIKGVFGKPFAINQETCTKCWMCVSQCPYPALMAFPYPAEANDADKAETALRGTSQSKNDSACSASAQKRAPRQCIFCNRCVETCRSEGGKALYFSGRGEKRTLAMAAFDGKTLCANCGECRIVCPTGAIESLFEPFQQRA